MKVSVITVCMNASMTIERCLKSVIKQKTGNVEYIVIDGASGDGTVDILRKYAKYITKMVSEPDQGIYDAMNKGIRLSTGDWITFINADDELAEGAVETVANFVAKNADVDVVYGDICYADGSSITRNKYDRIDLTRIYYEMAIAHPGTFIRGGVCKSHLFNTQYQLSADYDMLRRLYVEGYRFYHVPHVQAVFYKGGATSQRLYDSVMETCAIARRGIMKDAYLQEKYLSIIELREYLAFFYSVRDEIPQCREVCDAIREDLFLTKDIVIFGAGRDGREFASILNSINIPINAFTDNKSELWETECMGIDIKPPSALEGISNTVIIAASKLYYSSMKMQIHTIVSDESVDVFDMLEVMGHIGRLYYERTNCI